MKHVLFANPPWWTGSEGGKPGTFTLRRGIRAGSRWPFTVPSPYYPDKFKWGAYIPTPFFLSAAAAFTQHQIPSAKVVLRDSIARGESYKSFFDSLRVLQPTHLVIETGSASWEHDRALLVRIKDAYPVIKIAVAGPTVRSASVTDKGGLVDAWMLGEYEYNSVAFVNGATGLLPFNFLTRAEMDELPFPMYDHACALNYWDANPQGMTAPHLQMYSSRGCFHKCSFCSFPATMTSDDPDGTHARNVRFHSPQWVESFIKDFFVKYPQTKCVYFDDDSFNLSDRHVVGICAVMRKLGIPWSAMCRADGTSRETWQLMKDCGCFGVKVGFECIDGDTQIIMDSGECRPIREANGNAVAIDWTTKEVVKADSVLIDTPKFKEMVSLRTATREITASLDHRFFTLRDDALTEVRLGDLSPKDFVATVRRVPRLGSRTMLPRLAELAGFFLGDGTIGQYERKSFTYCVRDKVGIRTTPQISSSFRLSQKDTALLKHYAGIVEAHFGVKMHISKCSTKQDAATSVKRVIEWGATLRNFNGDGFQKIPDIITKGDDTVIASFLRGYYDAEGCVNTEERKIVVSCKFRRPMEQVKFLLLRLGIESGNIDEVRYKKWGRDFTQYVVRIAQCGSVRRFASFVGFNSGAKSLALARAVAQCKQHTVIGDWLPFSKTFVRRLAHRYLGDFKRFCAPVHRVMYGPGKLRRGDILRLIDSLESAGRPTCAELDILRSWAKGDVSFERIRDIRPVGLRRAYDLHVPAHSNFVAGGFVVHNSGVQRVVDDIIGKKLNLADAVETCRFLRSIGMSVHGTFTVGLPGETREEMHATIAFIRHLLAMGAISTHQLSGTAMIEGTPLERITKGESLAVFPGAKADGNFVVSHDGALKLEGFIK